jgi:hypothetical protein
MAGAAAGLLWVGLLAPSPVVAQWAPWRGVPDSRLELIVRSAYAGAAAHARADGNYFSRDGDVGPVRAAILARLAADGFAAVPVIATGDAGAVRKCASGGTELRVAINLFGDGLALAAVTRERAFAYRYEPREAGRIVVEPPGDCAG